MENTKSTYELKDYYGLRVCNLCNELFFIKSGKQRYAIQKEEAYHRKIICLKCWKEIYHGIPPKNNFQNSNKKNYKSLLQVKFE